MEPQTFADAEGGVPFLCLSGDIQLLPAYGGISSSPHLLFYSFSQLLNFSSTHRLICSSCICYEDEVLFISALIQFIDNRSKIIMKYRNLFQQQWYTQNLVDAFNADEALWDELEARRKLRRTLCSLTEEEYKALDLLEFESMRPPDDCIGKPLRSKE